MDECAFNLSSERKTRRVAPTHTPIKAQASLATDTHITLIATISTTDAIVPPYIIFPGTKISEEWLTVMDKEPKMMAGVSKKGWINGFHAQQWLTECFEPATKDRAKGDPRLLILDGHDTHVQATFLQACWDRNIVCLILPAHLTDIFQPLDVNFFNTLKLEDHRQVDEYQLGSTAERVSKAYFYRWCQRAWAATANSRQIRAAWHDAGLNPPDQSRMRAILVTPERDLVPTIPVTPQNDRMVQAMSRQLQKGEISPTTAFLKVSKFSSLQTSTILLLEKDLERRRATEELDKVARASTKRTRFSQGASFDQKYQEEHAGELAERREAEKQRKEPKKAVGRPRKKMVSSNPVEPCIAGPSTLV